MAAQPGRSPLPPTSSASEGGRGGLGVALHEALPLLVDGEALAAAVDAVVADRRAAPGLDRDPRLGEEEDLVVLDDAWPEPGGGPKGHTFDQPGEGGALCYGQPPPPRFSFGSWPRTYQASFL